MNETYSNYNKIDDSDFRIEWFSGTGKGGQHRNKHQNSCRLIHLPTNIIETKQGRKRDSNLKDAKSALLLKLKEMANSLHQSNTNNMIKNQIGTGMRGDKIRTYRFQDDRITDHASGESYKLKSVLRGNMDKFFK